MPRPNLAELNRQKAMNGNWKRIWEVLQERPDAPLLYLADRVGVSAPTAARAKKAIKNGWKPNFGDGK
jgi:hypothetical protein